MQNSKRRRNGLLLWLLYLSVISLCNAPAASAAAEPSPRARLEIVLIGKLGDNAVFRSRVSSWFEPERFDLRVRSQKVLDAAEVLAPSREFALSMWILLGDTSARIYFAAPAAASGDSRYLVRELTLTSGLDEIGAEQLAEVAHLSAVALLEGELVTPRQELERALATAPKTDVATAREEAAIERELSRRPQRPRRQPDTSAADRLDFGVGYGASFHTDEGVWHGPRANVGVRLSPVFALFVSSSFALPEAHDLGLLSLRIEALSLVTGVRLARRVAPALAFEVAAGPGVEVVHYAPERATTGVTLGSGATEARPELTTGLAVLLGTAPLSAVLIGELALGLSRTRYELLAAGGRRIIAEPALLVPRLGLEARF